MKQVFQDLKNGEISLLEVPCPSVKNNYILVQTKRSLISLGTERMLVDFGKANLIEKARKHPDKVKMVIEKVMRDGLLDTVQSVKSKLDEPLPLGYCNVGVVMDGGLTDLNAGTRVVSNGNHAEVVRVPKNLTATVPESVSDEAASFTVLAAIAMQGIRLINPTIGERVVVTGLGLIGLMAVQILKANGCRVLGIDFDSSKCELAKQFGAEVVDLSKGEEPLLAAEVFSRSRGVDAVLITASSKSNDIVHQAATMCRKRGRIVLVGVVGLELSRADFYEKELTFQVSCSYGPGRYDEEYEDGGKDYPFAYVRWTEQRNFEAVLDLMAAGLIDVSPLISHRFSINDAKAAYEKLDDKASLGIILDYSVNGDRNFADGSVKLGDGFSNARTGGKGNVAFIGGGNYASRVLIPAFKRAGANFTTLVTSRGISAVHHGQKNGFSLASTDIEKALGDTSDTVVVATQHNLHSTQVVQALNKGKNVFVEKPLALTHDQLDSIENAQHESKSILMVGYNRRFSPHVQKMKSLLESKAEPKTFIMTMNAGYIPRDHWTQDPLIGGGRIIGEACHYIDLMRFLAGSRIKSFTASKMGENSILDFTEDKAIITLVFEDGSLGSIHYFANGGKAFPKERIEVFCGNAVLQLNNFRKLTGFGWKGFKKMSLWSQDKGQERCCQLFMESVRKGGEAPIPLAEIFEVARVSVDIADILRKD